MPNTSDSETNNGGSLAFPVSAHETTNRDQNSHDHGPDNHLALIYESRNEQLAAVVPFIRQGLEQNERVMYVADENPKDELISAFQGTGLDVKSALNSGDLTFHTTEETYTKSGEFDAEEMIEFLDETARDAVENDSYDRLRITGEMTWALGKDAETLGLLQEYEGNLNQYFPGSPVIGLCQYNRNRFSPELLHDVIRAHPHQVYNATVTQNFAYLPPDEFFDNDAPAPSAEPEEFIETHLDRIRARGKLKEREQTLSELAESSQEILQGDIDAVATRLADTIQQALSPSVVAVFFYDDATDELQPQTTQYLTEPEDTISLPERYQELLWDSFVTDEPNVFSNFQSETAIPEMDATLQSGMALPLDRYGVLFISSTQAYAFEEANVEFARTVTATARSAIERAEHERTLEEKNERLRHLNQINSTIRAIDQALVQASTREEIETAVCDRLADADSYEFAWIGNRDPLTNQFIPQQWAGDGEPYLDELYAATSDTDGTDDHEVIPSPVRKALETGDVVTIPNSLTTSKFERWRKAVLSNGFHSTISIPLIHNNTEYGVLSVYSDTPDVFTEMEQEVLAELGGTTAYSIDAVETRASLHADRITEVGLQITDTQSRILRIARRIGGQLDVETVMPEKGDELRVFFTAHDVSPEDVLGAAEESVSVESIRQVTERDKEALFEAVINVSSTILSMMAGFDASITGLTASSDAVDVVVELPQNTDVRSFVNQFQQAYPETSVESVQRSTQPTQTQQTFYAEIEDRLTDRQLEALRLAYHSGYFEWPRASSGEEVADSLGVSQPTFTGHLRAGERKLFDLLFDT